MDGFSRSVADGVRAVGVQSPLMNSAGVQKEIDQSRRLAAQLEEAVVSKNQFPIGDRNVLLIAYWALIFDYHNSEPPAVGVLRCCIRAGSSGGGTCCTRTRCR